MAGVEASKLDSNLEVVMGCLGSKEKAVAPANGGGNAATAPAKAKDTAGSNADKPEVDETRLDADCT